MAGVASARDLRGLFDIAVAGDRLARRTGGDFSPDVDKVAAFCACPRSEAVEIRARIRRAMDGAEAAIEAALAADPTPAAGIALSGDARHIAPGLSDCARTIIAAPTQRNIPAEGRPDMRLVGWVVPNEVAGMHEALSALREIGQAALAAGRWSADESLPILTDAGRAALGAKGAP